MTVTENPKRLVIVSATGIFGGPNRLRMHGLVASSRAAFTNSAAPDGSTLPRFGGALCSALRRPEKDCYEKLAYGALVRTGGKTLASMERG